MTAKTTTAKRLHCPSCDKKAKRVSPVTLRALIKDQFVTEIGGGDYSCCGSNGRCTLITEDTGWRFCDSPDCDVVYFSEEGETKFNKSQLKVPVGVKETSGERPLCYCFGHSVASIKEELRTKGGSDALEDIRAKMNDPGCHCETSNPRGSCCLGSVSKGVEIAHEELKRDDSSMIPVSTGRGEKIAKIGTIVSAIMASACCWLPLVLLAVGVSGVGMAATLEEYRPLFIVVTFGFLAAAFYFTYRPKKVAAEGGQGCCTPKPAEGDAGCAPTGKRRFGIMAMNKVLLWVVTVLAVAFLFFPSYVGLFGTGDNAVETETLNRAVFKIEGMTCEGCATTVSQAIRHVPGIVAVDVSYEKKQAVVGVKPGDSIPKEELLTALKKAGYSGELLNSEETSEAKDTTAAKVKSSTKTEDAAQAVNTRKQSVRHSVLKIDGMTCEGCATGVSDAILGVPGITGVQVDFKAGQASLQSPACCTFPKDAVLSAVEYAGFKGEVIEDDAPPLNQATNDRKHE